MGSDGLRGSQQVREAGGQVLVQDEATSVVWGMPGQVAAAGLAAGVFPLKAMAQEVDRRVRSSRMGMRHPAVPEAGKKELQKSRDETPSNAPLVNRS
jgi:two-component system chemotaxis response regulator CheB